MRTSVAVLGGALLLAALPALAQQPAQTPVPYKLIFDPDQVSQGREGANNTLYVTVRFTISQVGEVKGDAWKEYKILIKENGNKVKVVDMPQPEVVQEDDLSLVLAMDVSGSMNEHNRIQRAREAANVFFNQLPSKAECGLILFDHELKVTLPPTTDRGPLLQKVKTTEPAGGTAFLEATKTAILQMLAGAKSKNKAVVLMTDGVDLNSRATLKEVIQIAKDAKVAVFTIGIGEPGKNDVVSTVLALDKSGSMLEPADHADKILKIDALKVAAARFIEIMRNKARATLLEFSDQLRIPEPFSGDKDKLRKDLEVRISQKTAGGETAFLDAAYTAVATLEADNPAGKKAVVVLTDGVDNSSRRRKEEVIKRAQDAKIAIYMLGLGRPGELDEDTMKEIAKATGGRYYHAGNQQKLLELFENLSIQLHDDGIDEDTLKTLATQTGGKYYPVKDVKDLKFILKEVSKTVQVKPYTEKFASLFQDDDGTRRVISLHLGRQTTTSGSSPRTPSLPGPTGTTGSDGFEELQSGKAHTQVHGVVVANMNYLVYLGMLGLLGVLLALPPALRKITRGSSGGS
jgi:VWFA-related protein